MVESLKDQVLKASRALFMERGYEAVGMRDIAAAVGKQPVQVYRLNLSKADILAELIIELNNEQIRQLPKICARIKGLTLFERVCSYLQMLYRLDVQYLPIRAVGAAFGWMWGPDHERRIIDQVNQLVKPIADLMRGAGVGDVSARCFGIWSLYYVGYRHAVMKGGTAKACLDGIKPSLRYYLETPDGR